MDENQGMRNGNAIPSLDNGEHCVRRYLCGELSGREEEEEEEEEGYGRRTRGVATQKMENGHRRSGGNEEEDQL
jgi:hypothetical protein